MSRQDLDGLRQPAGGASPLSPQAVSAEGAHRAYDFTPGPWKAAGASISAKGRGHIAKALEIFMDRSEREANARLIAAAPDMLRELQNLVNWYGARANGSGDDELLPPEEQDMEVAAAMRTISKALGKDS